MTGEEFLGEFWARAQAFGEQHRGLVTRVVQYWNEQVAEHSAPRRFELQRKVDESGVSGTGLVAWGTEFPNGKVALTWAKGLTSCSWFDSIEVLLAIHGHGGATEIVWIDR